MREILRKNLHKIANYLELLVAIVITVMIAISIINMIIHIASNPLEVQDAERFYEFMNDALSLIVGIEFLKMIIIPTADNVIETLLFAVSRHIILDHGIAVMIVGVICIVLLFFIKKYLFTSFEKTEERTFHANVPLERVNRDLKITLTPNYQSETLGEFMLKRFEDESKTIQKGESISIDNTTFNIESLDNEGNIKTISIYQKKD